MMNNIMDTTKIKNRILYLLRNKQATGFWNSILHFDKESILCFHENCFEYNFEKANKEVFHISKIKFTESELKEIAYLWEKRAQELIDNLVFDE